MAAELPETERVVTTGVAADLRVAAGPPTAPRRPAVNEPPPLLRPQEEPTTVEEEAVAAVVPVCPGVAALPEGLEGPVAVVLATRVAGPPRGQGVVVGLKLYRPLTDATKVSQTACLPVLPAATPL